MHTQPSRLTCLLCTALIIAIAAAGPAVAQTPHGLDLERDTLTQTVLIHPVIDASGDRMTLWTREHTYRSSLGLGDQLGRDFTLARVGEDGLPRTYRPGTDGARNEDWFGWRGDVLAPFDGTVTETQTPSSTNVPGTVNREGRPGHILFKNDEGVTVAYVHVREINVEKGQRVEAGEGVAKVGNNAISRAPHVHVGAWVGETPLQIQVDLYAAERHASPADQED